jgi:hypothetical protein
MRQWGKKGGPFSVIGASHEDFTRILFIETLLEFFETFEGKKKGIEKKKT